MDKKSVCYIYDKIAKSYADRFKEPSEYIDDFLNMVKKNGIILDIGCGPGTDANHISSNGFEVIAIDLSKEMIKLAKQKFPDIDFRIADMKNLKFKPNSFDGVFVSYSLIHISKKDVPDVLETLYRFLKHDGAVYIAVHEGKSEELYLGEPLMPKEKIFLNIFSYEEIKKLIEDAGFSIIKEYRRKQKQSGEFDFVKLFVLARK